MPNVFIISSDLHVGKTNIADVIYMRRKIERFSAARDWNIKACLLLGDIGESLVDIKSALETMSGLAAAQFAIPGNHCLFDTEHMGSSLRRYKSLLPALFRECGWEWGESGAPIIIPGLSPMTPIIMSPAWRDTARLNGRRIPRSERSALFGELPDAKWITPELDDHNMANAQLARFYHALRAIPPDVTNVIIATHFPVFWAQMNLPERLPGVADTFWFSPRFGRVLTAVMRKKKNVRSIHVISGHVHSSFDGEMEISGMRLRLSTIGSSYKYPEFLAIPI